MRTYTVQEGDSLTSIAEALYGDSRFPPQSGAWLNLAFTNGISPPYTIYPGQVLQVPNLPGDSAQPPALSPGGGGGGAAPPWYKSRTVWVLAGLGVLVWAWGFR